MNRLLTIYFLLLSAHTLLGTDVLVSETGLNGSWTFLKGGKFEGRAISFRGTNEVVMIGTKDKKAYVISLALLIEKDRGVLNSFRTLTASKQSKKRLEDSGSIELSEHLIKNFPEKVTDRSGWMDCEFRDANNDFIQIWLKNWQDQLLGFAVRDKEGNIYQYCFVNKKNQYHDGLDNAILGLKKGDKIRIKGTVEHWGTEILWLNVDEVSKLD